MSAPHGSPQALALASGEVPDGLVVALGDAVAPAGSGPVVRFGSQRRAPGELLIAAGGEDLWRTAPWPAGDELFELPEPSPQARVLVLGAQAGEVVERLAARDVPALARDALERGELEQAAVVLSTEGGPFPDHGFAVAAAARVLVLRCDGPLFGLQDGIDCYRFDHADEAATIAEAAIRSPEAFTPVRRLARLAAEPQRASRVYARLAVDLALGAGRVGVARNERSASST